MARRRVSSKKLLEEEESRSEDDSRKIRVGTEYQAVIPEYKPESPTRFSKEVETLLWSPNHCVSDAILDKYIATAMEKYDFDIEQALGLLRWYKYDVERTLTNLGNFMTLHENEWSVDDKMLFELAVNFHGKCFQNIQQLLPDKPIPSLVEYYYSWKKTRCQTSVMDRKARQLRGHRKGKKTRDEASRAVREGEPQPLNARHGLLSPYRYHSLLNQRCPPKGLYLASEDLTALWASPDLASPMLRYLNSQCVALKHQVQSLKQTNSCLRQALEGGINLLRPPEIHTKFKSRWTTHERLLAQLAISRYGTDFRAIAEVIGSKSLTQVKTFFEKDQCNSHLDKMLQEWEAKQGGNLRASGPTEEARRGVPLPASALEEDDDDDQIVSVYTPVPRPVPPAPQSPQPPILLAYPPPLVRLPLPTAPILLQPPRLREDHFRQHPPPIIHRPVYHHNTCLGPQPLPANVRAFLEPPEPSGPSLTGFSRVSLLDIARYLRNFCGQKGD